MASLPFGLKSRPFEGRLGLVAPFTSPTQEAVRASLAATLAGEENLGVLVGPAGVGKSLLVHHLADALRTEHPCFWIPAAPGLSVAGFLQALLFELNVTCPTGSEGELRLVLLNALLQHAGSGCFLVVDDAHLLSPALLHELRWLAQLVCPSGSLVHGMLVGDLVLRNHLMEPGLQDLWQFVAAQTTLEPMLPDEAMDYVRHHLLQAGVRPERVMPVEACELLVRCAGGVPRVINQLGSRALALACLAEAELLDCEAVLAAAEELGTGAELIEENDDEAAEVSLRMLDRRTARTPAGNRLAG